MSLVHKTYVNNYTDPLDFWIFVIHCDGLKDEYWFKATEVASFLEYEYPDLAILNYVEAKNRVTWKVLKNSCSINEERVPTSWKLHTMFVSEFGLFELLRTRIQYTNVKHFMTWVYKNVLPELRRTSNGQMETHLKKLLSTFTHIKV